MTRPAHARSNGPAGGPEAARDDVLLDAAHSGDAAALRALRERYHATALAVARSRTGSAAEAERLAEAALGRIEQIIGEGGGPRAFLGAFVVWMVGREADGGTRPVALPDDPTDPTSLVRVFSGLPAEWQGVLWRTEVLGQSPRRAAAALGLGAVAAAGLHRDMVRGLRGLYGRAAAERPAGPECAEFSAELAHFVRGTRGQRSRRDVKAHLDGCARCTAEYLSRQDIGTGLRTWTLPVLAGLPLWGTEALELAGLVAGSRTGAAAATGSGAAPAGAAGAVAAGAGAAAAGADATGPRTIGAAGASVWSGRRAKVLLGAGALATAVAVAAVGVSGGGDPVPAAGGPAAERAPRTAQDLERAGAGDPAPRDPGTGDAESGDAESGGSAAGAARVEADGTGSEGAAPDRPQGPGPAVASGEGPVEAAPGTPSDGAGPELAALVAGSGSGRAGSAAAEEGRTSAEVPGSSTDRGAARPGAAAQRPASGSGAAETGAPGAASSAGPVRQAASGTTPSGPPPARTGTPSPAPSPARETAAPAPALPTSLPTLEAGPAPLRAPAPATATPADPARTGTAPARRSPHAEVRAPRPGQAERGWRPRERSWEHDGRDRHHERGRDDRRGGRGGEGDRRG